MPTIENDSKAVQENWVVLLPVIFTCWYFFSTKRPTKFPPGPRGLPVIGAAPFIGKRPELTFEKWSKKYGDIFGFKMGQGYAVVLSSYDLMEEAFTKYGKYLNHRPNNFFFTDVLRKKGVAFHDYTPAYVTERKFMVAALSKLGIGKTTIEAKIIDEVRHLMEQFGSDDVKLNEATKEKILFSATNLVTQMTLGKRFASNQDPEYLTIVNGWLTLFEEESTTYLVTTLFPWLIYLPPIRRRAIRIKTDIQKVYNIFENEIAQHEETLDAANTRDLIDEYLVHLKKQPLANDTTFSKEMLMCTLRDFYGGGTDTTTSSIVYTLLLLSNRPKIMKKIHEEIDDVIGDEGLPHFVLRQKMPFLHAFIIELLRFRTIVPLAVPHCASENIEFRGYFIPKGTIIYPCVYSVHNDPRIWNKPEEFNPGRHLDDSGKVNLPKYFLPFGIGSRRCIAWRLAEMELFIYLVMILRKYDVVPTPTPQAKRPHVEDDGEKIGLTLSPPHNTPVSLILRKG